MATFKSGVKKLIIKRGGIKITEMGSYLICTWMYMQKVMEDCPDYVFDQHDDTVPKR